jgi:hypothetical protein
MANQFGGYYVITARGEVVLDQVAAYVTECLDRMEAGVMPWEEEPRDLPIKWFNKEEDEDQEDSEEEDEDSEEGEDSAE